MSTARGIRWGKQYVNVTSALVGEYLGLEGVEDGQWDVMPRQNGFANSGGPFPAIT